LTKENDALRERLVLAEAACEAVMKARRAKYYWQKHPTDKNAKAMHDAMESESAALAAYKAGKESNAG
jgi:hypothetical protein